MNEELLIAISVIGLMVVLSLPFIAVPVIIYKLYQKSRAAREQAAAEAQNPPVPPRRSTAVLVALCAMVVVYGLMTGFVLGVLSNLLYILFLFPFAIGLFNGILIADLAEKLKIRSFSHLVILSALSAAAIYGMLHYGRYAGFVVRASMEFSASFDEALDDQNLSVAKALVDYAMQEETGYPGFTGYMLYKVNSGVSIGRITRSSSFNLGPVLTVLYWLLELGIILGVTIQKGKTVTGRAVCEGCGNWLGGEKHLGGTTFVNESFLLSLIRQKDFAGLGSLMEPNAEVPSLEVYYQGCQVCGRSQSQLVVRRTFQNAKGLLEFSDACQTTLQPTESVLLLNQFSFSGD